MNARILSFFILSLVLFSCKKEENPNQGDINLFTIQDDIKFGKQLRNEVLSKPEEYGPVLDTVQYAKAYEYLYSIQDSIFKSNKVFYEDRFEWKIYIIDDSTLNAFASPGGYHFYYTGILKYLEAEDQLAGVMSHEMAHADRRHGTEKLTKAYGLSFMFDVLLGKESTAALALQGIIGLSYSRKAEDEADDASVQYLCERQYESNAVGDFFQKLEAESGGSGVPQFLSTHPSSESRVQNAQERSQEYGCIGTSTFQTRYEEFQNMLP
jgi:predicted Zn-dependent protease